MIEVTSDNQQQAADIFCEGFADDPVMNWIGGHHPKFISLMFEFTLPIFVPHGLTYMTDERNGAASWIGPQTVLKWPIRPSIVFKALGMIGFRGLLRFARSGQVTEKLHPREPHYYLFAIATTPDSRGQGVGTRLITELLRRCDEEGVAAYLENSKEANLAFYQGHGFEVTQRVTFATDAPPIWLMWREPRQAGEQSST